MRSFNRENGCFLCSGFVSCKNKDKTRILDHLQVEHRVKCNIDFLCGVATLDDVEMNVINRLVKDFQDPLYKAECSQAIEREDNDDIVELDGNIEFAPVETTNDDEPLSVEGDVTADHLDLETCRSKEDLELSLEEYSSTLVELDITSTEENLCTICDGKFVSKGNLRRHLRNLHRIDIEVDDNVSTKSLEECVNIDKITKHTNKRKSEDMIGQKAKIKRVSLDDGEVNIESSQFKDKIVNQPRKIKPSHISSKSELDLVADVTEATLLKNNEDTNVDQIDKSVESKKTLIKTDVAGNKNFSRVNCEICNVESSSVSNLKKHMKKVHKSNIISKIDTNNKESLVIGVTIMDKNVMTDPMGIETNGTINCMVCGVQVKSTNLRKHLMKMHEFYYKIDNDVTDQEVTNFNMVGEDSMMKLESFDDVKAASDSEENAKFIIQMLKDIVDKCVELGDWTDVTSDKNSMYQIRRGRKNVVIDPNLPDMWLVQYRRAANGSFYREFFSPDGNLFRSMKTMFAWMEESQQFSHEDIKKVGEYLKKPKPTFEYLKSLEINMT